MLFAQLDAGVVVAFAALAVTVVGTGTAVQRPAEKVWGITGYRPGPCPRCPPVVEKALAGHYGPGTCGMLGCGTHPEQWVPGGVGCSHGAMGVARRWTRYWPPEAMSHGKRWRFVIGPLEIRWLAKRCERR